MNSFILEIFSYSAVKTIKHIYRKKNTTVLLKKTHNLKTQQNQMRIKEKTHTKKECSPADLSEEEGCSKIPH